MSEFALPESALSVTPGVSWSETESFSGARVTESWRDRVLLARIGDRDWGFPAPWVNEILVINRNQLMPLPFYGATVLGVIHHQGQLLTVADGQRLLLPAMQGQARAMLSEQVTVVALGPAAPNIAGVGILVDRVLGSESTQGGGSSDSSEVTWQMLDPSAIDPQLWQPLRWQASISSD